MELDAATTADDEAIRGVVRRSLRASYALSPTVIDAVLDTRFGDGELASRLDREDAHALVARTDDDGVVGYADGIVDGAEGTLDRIHVDPDHRGEGIGTTLLAETREALEADGATTIRAHVLDANAEGTEFYEEHGFAVAGYDDREFAGETFPTTIYTTDQEAVDSASGVPETVSHDETTLSVDQDPTATGTDEPFYDLYRDGGGEDEGEPYGYYCGNCGAVVVAVGGQGSIECDDCGNEHRSAEWDGAYL